VTEDGRHIELTFNKPIKGSTASQATFSLTKNNAPLPATVTSSLRPGDGTTILVALDTAFARGDTVTVAYVSGSIESEDGGILAPFGPVEVYN
jgi:hypothetical protein